MKILFRFNQRWFEIGVIVVTGTAALLYWLGFLELPLLYGAVALGLVPLARTAVLDLLNNSMYGFFFLLVRFRILRHHHYPVHIFS